MSTATGIIDAFFCINLPARIDRKAHAQAQFGKAGLSVEFIRAVTPKLGKGGLSPQRWGCVLSHGMAIDRIANDPKISVGCIFEDDVVLCNNFADRLRKFIDEVPGDWDMLALGYDMKPEAPHIRHSDNILKLNYCWGAHAYVLNKRSARLLLEYRKTCILHNDVYLSKFLCEKHRAYGYYPCLAKQRLDNSTLHKGLPISWQWINQCRCFSENETI